MLEHLLTVADEMLGIKHRQFDIVFAEEVQQQLLALDLRQLAEVAIPPEEVEGVVDEPALPACSQLCLQPALLQFREVGASFMDDHYLPIDDGFAQNG